MQVSSGIKKLWSLFSREFPKWLKEAIIHTASVNRVQMCYWLQVVFNHSSKKSLKQIHWNKGKGKFWDLLSLWYQFNHLIFFLLILLGLSLAWNYSGRIYTDFRSCHQGWSLTKVFSNEGVLRKFRKIHRETSMPKRLWNRCVPVNFLKFLRAPFYRTPLGDYFWDLFLRME